MSSKEVLSYTCYRGCSFRTELKLLPLSSLSLSVSFTGTATLHWTVCLFVCLLMYHQQNDRFTLCWLKEDGKTPPNSPDLKKENKTEMTSLATRGSRVHGMESSSVLFQQSSQRLLTGGIYSILHVLLSVNSEARKHWWEKFLKLK